MDINSFLKQAIDKNASDLHILTGHQPILRINDNLYPCSGSTVLTAEEAEKLLLPVLNESQKELYSSNKEIDLSYEYGDCRFRANIYTERGNPAASFRLIPRKIKTVEELGLPSILHTFIRYKQGLILITGPTSQGKSTTLASLINEINIGSNKHIITLEDPIEFVYPSGKSIISQRELHQDTHSFSMALRSVLREDPDVVLLGEMRDYETIQSAMTIAETGHLVLSTLHTRSAPETIDRIVDVFPSNQQNQIKNQLASILIGVVAQRLLPDLSGKNRLPACEILINNTAVSSLIREGKSFMLDNILTTSEDQGMILFEKSLLDLYQRGLITKQTVMTYAIRSSEIKKLID